jgi:RNA 3'-terminal phosphate cyclase (ATP)
MKTSLIAIDGAAHEGGGQILRTALALSVVTGKPFRITRIRAGRPKPGLMRQHLASVDALAKISGAQVEGAMPGSGELTFTPGPARGGEYRFVVGTAGSTVLVAQAILPALLVADKASEVVIEGGTHNPHAPPFEFFAETFLPALRAMGAEVEADLEAHGFYPAGGGQLRLRVKPWKNRVAAEFADFGGDATLSAFAIVSNIPTRIGDTEIRHLRAGLPSLAQENCVVTDAPSPGPGNLLGVRITKGGLTTVVAEPGERGTPSEAVAERVASRAERFVGTTASVCEHLADQLLIPAALVGGAGFVTAGITPHFEANAGVVRQFLPEIQITHNREGRLRHRVILEKKTVARIAAISVPRG